MSKYEIDECGISSLCKNSRYHGDCNCELVVCPDCEEEMYWSKAPWQENAIYECYSCDYIKEVTG